MVATNQFNASTHAKFQTLVTAISNLLPTTVGSQTFSGFDFSFSPGFRLVLEVSQDGRTLVVTTKSSDQGPNNAFGPPDGTIPAGGSRQHYVRSDALIIDGAQMP